jgi:putative hydrolase of the HAD superfamily
MSARMTKRLTWIFDLDNTLHDYGSRIMPHVSRSMTEFLRRELGVPEAEATRLRQAYLRRYGATLAGMMRLHGTDPRRFLEETHRVPDLERAVSGERGLRHALRRIPGRKLLFSNSPLHYAERVLRVLRIEALFDALYCIERARFHPKPSPRGFRLLLRAERLVPGRCVLVDDMLDNLRAAKSLGMKTVWVSRESRVPPSVDLRVASVLSLPRLADDLSGSG